MRIFIGNLPVDFTSIDLRRLACSMLMPGNTAKFLGNLFKKTYKIKRTAFEVIGSEQGYYETPFGVIYIEPDSVGQKLVEKLDQYYIRETVLVAREFYVRAYSNDRRAINWRSQSWDNDERRWTDRRLGIIIPKAKSVLDN